MSRPAAGSRGRDSASRARRDLTATGHFHAKVEFRTARAAALARNRHVAARGGDLRIRIRNTDTAQPITLNAVKYFNTAGKLVKNYLERPVSLAPLATTEVLVKQQDTKGGSGANFLVEWSSREEVNLPRVEAVMVGSEEQANISFVSVGVPLKE